MFQKFELESSIGPAMVDGQLVKTLKHETVPGVYTYQFKVSSGSILFCASGGILKEVSYRLDSVFPWVRKKNVRNLFDEYGIDGEWKKVAQDRFGVMYRSAGGLYYAAVGKSEKFIDIGSMSFHESKFRIVS